MKIMIIGAGRRAERLARLLIGENHNVIIIEQNPQRLETLAPKLDCMMFQGNGSDLQILKEAGIESCDAIVSVTDSDELNLVSCGLCKSIVPSIFTIAVTRTKYLSGIQTNSKLFGLDIVLNPAEETAKSLSILAQNNILSDIISFEKTNFLLYTFTVTANNLSCNKTVSEFRSLSDVDFVISSITKNGVLMIPTGDTIINSGDKLSIITRNKDISKLVPNIHEKKKNRKGNLVIVGAANVAHHLLSKMTSNQRSQVILIDKNYDVCEEVAAKFNEITVLNSDVTDDNLFEDECLKNSYAFFSLTNNDELNIVIASYAKRVGIKRSIALLVNNSRYIHMGQSLDIDKIVSTTAATVDSLLALLRGPNFVSVHNLEDGQGEVFELEVASNSKADGQEIKNINLKGKATILAITRDKISKIPVGSDIVKASDTLLISAKRGSISTIKRLFTKS